MSSFVADKIVMDGLTYDDVLLIPAYSEVLPKQVELKTKFSRNIELNVPFVTAAMDTVTEASMAIAIAREGGIGVIHKNMTIEEQARQVAIVKRAENGMIYDPVTILCMVSNTLEAGMLPSVFLLVLGKISSLCLFIIRCSLPYHPVADFIEQQSVMILLHKIFQILVVSRQF